MLFCVHVFRRALLLPVVVVGICHPIMSDLLILCSNKNNSNNNSNDNDNNNNNNNDDESIS